MREFTKAVISYGWASTMFQVQQLANAFTTNPSTGNNAATDAYNEVARETAEQLGPTMQATYRVGDAMQRSMVNVMFGMVGMSDASRCQDARRLGSSAGAALPPRDAATRQPVRPSWRAAAGPDAAPRRPVPADDAAPQGGSVYPRPAVQGWGPMP